VRPELRVPAAAGGDAGGDAPQQNGSQQNGGPDLSAFAEQLGQMSESQERMRAFLQTAPWAQQQETGESTGTDGVDLSFLDADDDELAGYDDDGDDEATQETIEALANATEGFVENSIAPLAERLDAMQRQAEWRQVAEEFPDLEDREVQRDVFEAAQALGDSQGWPVEIWSSPQMVKTVYLAQQAVRIAQEEGEDGEVPAAHLEGGAGAGAGGGGPTDEITQMLGAKSGRHTSLPVR
jgi:hypothetical protein